MILIIRIAYSESLALRHLIRPYVPILSGDTKPSSVAITASGVNLPVAGFSSVGTPAIVNSNVFDLWNRNTQPLNIKHVISIHF